MDNFDLVFVGKIMRMETKTYKINEKNRHTHARNKSAQNKLISTNWYLQHRWRKCITRTLTGHLTECNLMPLHKMFCSNARVLIEIEWEKCTSQLSSNGFYLGMLCAMLSSVLYWKKSTLSVLNDKIGISDATLQKLAMIREPRIRLIFRQTRIYMYIYILQFKSDNNNKQKFA